MKLQRIAPLGLVAAALVLTACGGTAGAAKDNAAPKVSPSVAAPASPVEQPASEAPAGEAPAGEAPAQAPAGGAPAGEAPAKKGPQTLTVAKLAGFAGPVLINGKGRTIYRFDKDSNKPAKSTCFDACAKTWEPVLAGTGVQLQDPSIKPGLIGSIARPEGQQVTLNGWPLYYFKTDLKLGQIAGQGSKGTWFAIAPTGKKAKQTGGGNAANSGRR